MAIILLTYYNMSYRIGPMFPFRSLREDRNISQRRLANLAGVSFRTLQLAESGEQNLTIFTLEKILKALGYPPHILETQLHRIFKSPPESVCNISEKILEDGKNSWKIHLFNFVDAFCMAKNKEFYLELSPAPELPLKLKALLASVVEFLCMKFELQIPSWCRSISSLSEPWFLAETENLKATALLESPAVFRKRNLFVLENFLERA